MVAWHHHGSYASPRAMFASAGFCLGTHVLLLCLCHACTFVVAMDIPDRGRGRLNSMVKCATTRELCVLCMCACSGPRKVLLWHHKSLLELGTGHSHADFGRRPAILWLG